MINRIGFTTPQQRPTFKGRPEIEAIKKATKGLDEFTPFNVTTLASRLAEIKKSNTDLETAAKEINTWHADLIKKLIKKIK